MSYQFKSPGRICYLPLDWEIVHPQQLGRWMIGVILSAMAYGGVLSLTLSYIPLLLKTSYDISRSRRIFLLVYVTFMVAISTLHVITTIIALKASVPAGIDKDELCGGMFILGLSPDWFQNGDMGGFCITFASWGADGFMVRNFQVKVKGVLTIPLYSSGDARRYMRESRDHVE